MLKYAFLNRPHLLEIIKSHKSAAILENPDHELALLAPSWILAPTLSGVALLASQCSGARYPFWFNLVSVVISFIEQY